MTEEQIQKARTAGSAEELLEMAKAEGIELTLEQAQESFTQLNPPQGELADEELSNVAGGGCGTAIGTHEYTVVTSCHRCGRYVTGYWENSDGEVMFSWGDNPGLRKTWYQCSSDGQCGRCRHLKFKGSTGVCDIPMD